MAQVNNEEPLQLDVQAIIAEYDAIIAQLTRELAVARATAKHLKETHNADHE